MLPRLLVVFAAILFSTGGAAIKGTSFGGWQTAGLRSLVAALALWAVLPEARRIRRLRLLPVAFAYALTLVLFVHANKCTTSANAIFLQSTAPLHILYLAPLLLRERLGRLDLVHALAVAGGMALFLIGTQQPLATAPRPVLGNVLAMGSGLAYAAMLTGLRWLGQRYPDENPGLPTVAAGNLLAFLLCAPMAFPLGPAAPLDWGVIIYLGTLQIGLAYVMLTRALKRVPAFEASTLLLVEPVLNPVWAWWMQGERPAGWALVGGAVILAGTAGRLVADARSRS